MKRPAILLILLSVISSGAAYGNSFLNQFSGKWNVSQTLTIGSEIQKQVFSMQLKKFKNGTYYLVTNTGRLKSSERYFYKNGTLKSIFYDGDGNFSGDGSGTWRIDKGNLHFKVSGEQVYLGYFSTSSRIQRLNRNTYSETGTARVGSIGARVAQTYRRIR